MRVPSISACMAVLVMGCGGNNTATTPTSATIPTPTAPTAPVALPVIFSGRVVDYRTGAPLPSASVFMSPANTHTDADGRFTATVPNPGSYSVYINARAAGFVYVTGPASRGDVLVDTGTCISRYGVIIDNTTLQPISGAKVTIGPGTNIGSCSTSGSDGWYRCDLGCSSTNVPGNTTVLGVTHPDYELWTKLEGRGIGGVLRTDVALKHR